MRAATREGRESLSRIKTRVRLFFSCLFPKNEFLVNAGSGPIAVGDTAVRDENFGSPSDTPLNPILALVLVGRTNRQIADQLGLGVAEVERVIGTAKLQLGVRTRQEAALIIATRSQSLSGLAGINLRSGENRNHFEPRSAAQATKLVDTKNEESSISAYVRDVGNNMSGRNIETDIVDERRSLNNLYDSLNDAPIMKNILLMFLIITVGSFATGSLVSALQGLDILFNS